MAKGVFSRELVGSMIEVKKNSDERRVNMYRDYAARGLDIPFHLANDEKELAKYSTEAMYNDVNDRDDEQDLLDAIEEL